MTRSPKCKASPPQQQQKPATSGSAATTRPRQQTTERTDDRRTAQGARHARTRPKVPKTIGRCRLNRDARTTTATDLPASCRPAQHLGRPQTSDGHAHNQVVN
eukprot:scaffold3542_cov113-Isochrysis_galbana.AAC.11